MERKFEIIIMMMNDMDKSYAGIIIINYELMNLWPFIN